MIDTNLLSYATPRQIEFLEAVEKHGSATRAEKAMGLSKDRISASLRGLRARAAKHGYSPQHDMTKTVPEGFLVKGVSTYYDDEGKPRGQWVKTSIDAEKQEMLIRCAIDAMSQEVKGLSPHIDPPKHCLSDLLSIIPIGDPHHGLYAWAQESGDDWDSDIARDVTLGAVDRLIASGPSSETCVILPLGDVFHANDQTNQTPAHKHQLDVDSRFVRVLEIGIETYRHAVIRALQKHQKVIVRFVSGNHDPQAIWALAFTIHAYFSNEPRVQVDLSPSKFWFYKFGKVLIGSTHGDTVKPEGLLGVMAADRPEDWGATKHRYFYTGHIHSKNMKEFPGLVWESFRTLAAKDAYAAGHGYRAGRDMTLIVHHKEHGEIERHRVDIGMLQ